MPKIRPANRIVPMVNGTAPPADQLDDGAAGFPEPQTQTDRIALALVTTSDPRSKVKVCNTSGAWCADYAPNDWEKLGLGDVRRRFGAGNYHVLVYGKKPGTNNFGIVAREEIELLPDMAAAIEPAPAAAPAAPSSSRLEQLLEQLLARQAAPAAQAPPPPSLTDQLALFKQLKDVFGSPPPPQSTLMEAIELQRSLRAMAAEFSGEQPEAGWRDVLELLKPLVPRIVEAARPAGAAPAAPPIVTEPIAVVDPAEIERVFAQLLDWAMVDAPIAPAADLVHDKLPDALWDLLQTPTWFDELSRAVPPFAAHRAWLTKVRDAAIALDSDGASEAA